MGLENLLVTDIKGGVPSSVFGNALEALVGAVFLDKGYLQTQKIILHKVIKQHLEIEILINENTDYKSQLINHCQRQRLHVNFKILSEKKVGLKKVYHMGIEINHELVADASHNSKRAAEQLAAQHALEKIEG